MRLTDLDPNWLGAGGEGIYSADGSPVPERLGVGISFDCPCGKHGDRAEYERIAIEFTNPLDGKGPYRKDGHTWEREGTTFETLTLKPSILRVGGCGWHGWVTNGEVTGA